MISLGDPDWRKKTAAEVAAFVASGFGDGYTTPTG